VVGLLLYCPLPNRKGGNWLSGAGTCGSVPVLKFLALVSEGRSSPGFLFSCGRLTCIDSKTMSDSNDEGIDSNDVSEGVRSGVGDCSCTVQKGILCGRGDMSSSMSMASWAPGDEEGMGGVVRFPGAHVSQGGKEQEQLDVLTRPLEATQAIGEECSPRSWQLWTAA
jgi:hypothetical protein